MNRFPSVRLTVNLALVSVALVACDSLLEGTIANSTGGTDSSDTASNSEDGTAGSADSATGGQNNFGGQSGTGGQNNFGGQGGTGGQSNFGGQGGTGGQSNSGGTGGENNSGSTGGQSNAGGQGGIGGQSNFGGTGGQSNSGGQSNTGGQGGSGGQSNFGGQGGTGGQSNSGGQGGIGGQSNSGGQGGTGGSANGSCGPGMPLFPPSAPFNTPIDTAPLDSESNAIINYLAQNHTADARFQVDFSLTVLTANAQTPHRAFTPTDDHYSPDCDTSAIPLPTGGALEGEDGYACTSDGDCHLLVVDTSACKLYEMWRADIEGQQFNGGCLAVWTMNQAYPTDGRGEYCTSADAAGLPLTPLTFSADEIAAGNIAHAIRFIIPNELIRSDIYVHPGTHSTGSTSGSSSAPPYAARLRLKANADLSGLNPAALVVAHALQRYGMFLADAGNVTFTAANDRDGQHSWDEVGFGPHDLKGLSWNDFEVVELGQRFAWSQGECTRTPLE